MEDAKRVILPYLVPILQEFPQALIGKEWIMERKQRAMQGLITRFHPALERLLFAKARGDDRHFSRRLFSLDPEWIYGDRWMPSEGPSSKEIDNGRKA
jgi:hypothetical protein